MCNKIMSKEQLISDVILNNQKQLKHIDEWVILINDSLSKQKKLTKRSIAHMINIIGKKKNNITIQRKETNGSIFYEANTD